jgi:hypothetical protein
VSIPATDRRGTADTWSNFLNAIEQARSRGTDLSVVVPYECHPDDRNEATLFLKPELTSDKNADLAAVLDLLQKSLAKYKVDVQGAAVLSGPFLASHNIMPRHYGAINKASREGLNSLNPQAQKKLQSTFAEALAAGAEVLGGHQFLNKYPYFTPKSLSVLWDCKSATSVKLAPGAYAADFRVLDRRVVIVNGFNPYQIEYYTEAGKAIFVLVVRSATPWSTLRSDLIGATDPAQAAKGSIRQKLLANKKKWGLRNVDRSLNGVHLSAGPIEGYFEIRRFFQSIGDVEGCANFLRAYNAAGLDEAKLDSLSSNPLVGDGKNKMPLFDATEEMDMDDAIAFLSKRRK